MKVVLISDITLEALGRRQLRESAHVFSFIYAEDLILELSSFDKFDSFDIFYIHFDTYFKKYTDTNLNLILQAVYNFTHKTDKQVLCSNIFSIGWTTVAFTEGLGTQFNHNEERDILLKKLMNKANFAYVDVCELITDIGRAHTYRYEMGHLYQMPYTKLFLDKFASFFNEVLFKLIYPDRKVIVLDCDNTLWKGIVGEEGIEGIACDLNYEGILYYHFQQFLFTRKLMGFILCLCSKNNENDVYQAFNEKRMPLKWDDFLVKKINWRNKDENIKEIAQELNLGLDSFIFIDDNDFELANIRESLPEVKLFKILGSYDSFIEITKNLIFYKKIISKEDRNKTEQYLIENKRRNLERSSTSFTDYIKSLEIQIKIDEDNENELLRVSQLTEKTNQFNFNKTVFTVEQLRSGVQSGVLKYFTLRASDKFGDYGLVGVILLDLSLEEIVMENYILSCRILGRRIEYDFFNEVKKLVCQNFGKEITLIKFKETSKNIPAQNFYNQLEKAI